VPLLPAGTALSLHHPGLASRAAERIAGDSRRPLHPVPAERADTVTGWPASIVIPWSSVPVLHHGTITRAHPGRHRSAVSLFNRYVPGPIVLTLGASPHPSR